jgi:DNA-binding NarL/FixJ family response regulator
MRRETMPTKSSGGKKSKKQVFLVDDHPLVRQALSQLINQEGDLAVCGEAEGAPEALRSIAALKPDVAVVDLTLKEGSGLDLVKDLKLRHPELPVLVLSMHDESTYAERLLRSGARGYVMKDQASDKVVTALRRVLDGEVYLSEKMSARILHKLVGGAPASASPVDLLSDRELQVFELLGQGIGTRRIAEKLHLSVKTVETYREHIKIKLKLDNATDLLQHAIQWAQSK